MTGEQECKKLLNVMRVIEQSDVKHISYLRGNCGDYDVV